MGKREGAVYVAHTHPFVPNYTKHDSLPSEQFLADPPILKRRNLKNILAYIDRSLFEILRPSLFDCGSANKYKRIRPDFHELSRF